MRLLNRHYRGVDRATDVLSFPQYRRAELAAALKRRRAVRKGRAAPSTGALVLGDVVINVHRAERQAAERGLSVDEEVKRLLIHGVLHLLGHDHEQGGAAAKQMWRLSAMLDEKIDGQ